MNTRGGIAVIAVLVGAALMAPHPQVPDRFGDDTGHASIRQPAADGHGHGFGWDLAPRPGN